MRIVKRGTGQEAVPVDGLYQCFPKSENNRGKAVRFATIEKAAAFLCENVDWGIYMNPGGALVYRDIVIERDE
ncbi:MAG: hypothetical protein EKK31_14770 [Hyphomicrobiales bacterium]|nr:MAG: hypothetical protein EKK31_14770 [Hyphomicrobiales bacterium]